MLQVDSQRPRPCEDLVYLQEEGWCVELRDVSGPENVVPLHGRVGWVLVRFEDEREARLSPYVEVLQRDMVDIRRGCSVGRFDAVRVRQYSGGLTCA